MTGTLPRRAANEHARIRDVRIVVPARDEERTLETCLASLSAAMDALGRTRRGRHVRVRVVLVLDSCQDSSLTIAKRAAQSDPRIRHIERAHGSVGRARRDGAQTALTLSAPRSQDEPFDLQTVWIASTDADSVVSTNWLIGQLEFADAGTDLLLGTVLLTESCNERDAELTTRWLQGYVRDEGHPHVHGANLGVRASTYLEAGGFPPLQEHEDVQLVSAVVAIGATVHATALLPVLTSSRRTGRTPGGFAAFLSEIESTEPGPRDNRDTTMVRSTA